jgi:uncharacterized protein (TIGR00661 family)
VGNKIQNKFILNEFPEIKTELLDGYNITLSSKKSTYLQILKQAIKIQKSIKAENLWLSDYCKTNTIDIIISDNRYGFYNSETESIFISHQIQIEVPLFKKLTNKKLSKYINNFNCCWIPDDKKLNLSGNLSNTILLKIPFIHIGILSRFSKKDTPTIYDYLFVISGPNPENSIFLKQVEEFIKLSNLKFSIVSTLKSNSDSENITYFLNPSTSELNELINQSKCVISKSGYTTIMELVALNKKAFLIPTKGQFEQEYLAKHVKNNHITFASNLNEINLNS